MEGASSENLADGVDLGIIKAGSTMTKVISLHAASLGRRELDIAAHIRPVPLDSSATSAEGGVDHNPRDEVAYREGDRLLEDSVAITTIRPFDVRPHVTYGPVHRDEKGARCLATVSMSFDPAGGGGGVEVENIALESSVSFSMAREAIHSLLGFRGKEKARADHACRVLLQRVLFGHL